MFGICLLLFLPSAFAQPNDHTEKTKIIRWPKFYKASISSKQPAVAGIRVIPIVWNKEHLGYVQVGMRNATINAVPAQPLPEFLQEYVTRQYKPDFKTQGVHLLWVVKDLRISERTWMSSENAFVKIKADAYASMDGNSYRLAARFDTVLCRGGVDVTAWHGQNLAEVVHLLLKRSLESLHATISESNRPELTVQQIEEEEKRRFNVPVLLVQNHAEGVYINFEEFLANKPSVTQFHVDQVKNKLKLYTINGLERQELTNIWGLCKQGEMYRYEDGELIPIEPEENGFVISTYRETVNRRNKSMFNGAMLGGVLGGAVGGFIGAATSQGKSPEKLHTVNTIPYLGKKQPYASIIDIETGELTF